MDRDELAAWLRLELTPGVGRGTARRLLAAWGLPTSLFATPASDLRMHASAAQVQALMEEPAGWQEQVERTWQWLHESPPADTARALIPLGDPRYPSPLLQTEDPPLLLYVMGRASWLEDHPFELAAALAVVGSRNPTAQGAEHAYAFARALRQAGLTIVSGLALGVDAAAHRGALDSPADLRSPATVAVVGTGLDRVYPRAHRELAHQIAQHGLLISEYPLGTPPLASNFPQRNRIISGLSQGTLVVEAALASGSLITARLASEQGREVFAIPGSIHAPQSRGCHALIRQGAKLVESAQDILEELRPPLALPRRNSTPEGAGAVPATTLIEPHAPPASSHGAASVPPESPLLQALGFDPVGMDTLVERTGLPTAELQVALLELELDGRVARLPGGWFQRMQRT